jgi:hypothetical protein
LDFRLWVERDIFQIFARKVRARVVPESKCIGKKWAKKLWKKTARLFSSEHLPGFKKRHTKIALRSEQQLIERNEGEQPKRRMYLKEMI